MDLTLYWFMFPVSICVATSAMLSGIGGAALFTPIFLIIFPLLGPEYVLASTVTAIGCALLTETFGFTSGFIGYLRRKLIDFHSAIPFIKVAVPVGIAGAILSQFTDPAILKIAYGVLMLIIAQELVRHGSILEDLGLATPPNGEVDTKQRPPRTIITNDKKRYDYHAPYQGRGAWVTGLGGFLTGMVSVGIGEVVMPQLIKYNRIPVPVAAATSVFIVIVTVACASFTQIAALIAEGGWSAVPWNLVMYTIPGVLIGGQIGTHLQGRITQKTMETAIGLLFLVIGCAMIWLAVVNL